MIVKTQAELDAALANPRVSLIEIRSERGFWLHLSSSGSATVSASGSATVTAYDSATVTAYGSATVSASGSATVSASGSATVTAYDSATVTAYGSATVSASGSATVTAYGSATVSAYGSASLHMWQRSKSTATPHVSVHLHSANATVDGGVIIDVTQVNATAENWLEHHGVEVTDGTTVLYKAVNDQWSTPRGFDYSPGAEPSAPDWRDNNDCGFGLHLSPRPIHAKYYHPDATRYVACRVNVADLRVIDDGGAAKAKVRSCVVLYEVDVDGERIEVKR